MLENATPVVRQVRKAYGSHEDGRVACRIKQKPVLDKHKTSVFSHGIDVILSKVTVKRQSRIIYAIPFRYEHLWVRGKQSALC